MALKPHIVYYPFALLYGAIVALRNTLFHRGILKETPSPIPLIGVGNLSAGGTGKTPHVEYLVEKLLNEGRKVAMISRGYGRTTKGFLLADEQSRASEIGDEPWQLKHKFPQLIVAVDANRRRAIRKTRELYPDLQVIVMDDSFQHRYVKPDLNIMLMDYHRPIWRDHLLPAGYLREWRRGRKRADVIIVTKCPAALSDQERKFMKEKLVMRPEQKLFYTYVANEHIYCLAEPNKPLHLKEGLLNRPVMLITGIANPYELQHTVAQHTTVYPFFFPDHHRFEKADLRRVEQTAKPLRAKAPIILTTEKDIARLYEFPEFIRRWNWRIFILPVKVRFKGGDDLFLDNPELMFSNLLDAHVNKHR